MKIFVQWIIAFCILITAFSCNKESGDNDIISLTLSELTGAAVINNSNHTVLAEVISGTDLTAIAPILKLSDGASSNPASGEVVDFSGGAVNYTVTAENGNKQNWSVIVVEQNSSAAEILAFTLEDQSDNAIIGDSTIEIAIYSSADITHLAPVITISPGAIIRPASGDTIDFTSGDTTNLTTGTVIYTVTAEDSSIKHWYVTVTRPLNVFYNILSFTIPGQLGESVISVNAITLEVPYGTDLTAITPEIVVSPYATVNPASGQAVDFSNGYVTYTVTSEAGSQRTYKVYINFALLPADNENIQYCGRIDFSSPSSPRFWAPGVYIKARYQGSECVIVINDQTMYGTNHNYLQVVIDDTINYRIQTSGNTNNIKVGEGLPEGSHTLLISKATEGGIGFLQLQGFRCEALLPLDPLPTRKIEFIGNSITAGTGIDVSLVACDAGAWYDQMNAYFTYGAITARTLNAQYHLTAVGGIGLTQSCCSMGYVMPQVFGKINPGDPASANWDFSQYIPDVVTICLGQNDGVQDSITFCSAYVSFIGQIRTVYPSAKIVLLTSPMADLTLTNALKNYLTGVVDYMNTHGDANVSKYFFSTSYNSGCQSHPSKDEHVLIANELTSYLETLMGW